MTMSLIIIIYLWIKLHCIPIYEERLISNALLQTERRVLHHLSYSSQEETEA